MSRPLTFILVICEQILSYPAEVSEETSEIMQQPSSPQRDSKSTAAAAAGKTDKVL